VDERAAAYADAAHATVDVDGLDEGQVVDRVLEVLGPSS
jgi:hypothetical protein